MVLAVALAAPVQELQVFDREGWRSVQWLQGDELAVVPVLVRSPVVARAAVGPRGARLRTVEGGGDDWTVTAIEHRVDERVLLIEGRPQVVGPPHLPFDASDGELGSALPVLARQDAESSAGPLQLKIDGDDGGGLQLVIVPAARERSVALALRQEDGTTRFEGPLGNSACAAIALPVRAGSAWVTVEGMEVDQLFLATVRPPGRTEQLPAVPSGRTNEVYLELPESPAFGRTWSLVVDAPRFEGDWTPGPDWSLPTPEWAREMPSSAAPLIDIALDQAHHPVHLEGPDEQLDIRPTMGPGVAWGDIAGSGSPELYVVQGGGRDGSVTPRNRMLQWNRTEMIDITAASGADDDGWGMGAQFFDADGNGTLELYVANYGPDVLYGDWNEYRFALGGGMHPPAYADLTEQSGISGDRWSAGVAAGDPDKDGDLDLYVTSYLNYDPDLMPPVEDLPLLREDPIEMLPFAFPGERNVYYRNESTTDGIVFVDATEELGLLDEEGRGMQPLFFDFDADGAEDLYVANDVSFNVLWQGDGAGAFRDVSFQTGMDDPRGGMGVSVADVDGDLDEDLFLTNWQLEANALYRNNRLSHRSQRHRVATFRDVTVQAGFGPHSVGYTSWGCEFFDLELDGDLDLFVANGYTSPDYESTGICVGQPNHLFTNDGEGRFTLVEGLADLERELPSRAVVACDFDRDGDEDLVVTTNNGPLQLLENRATDSEDRPAWLGLELRGRDGNTRAIGARVTVTVGDLTQLRTMRAGRSYLGGNPPELLFGFGPREGSATVEITWPSGQTSAHTVDTRQWTTIEEPEAR